MDCRIESTTSSKLQELINKYGQQEGLTRFIKQTVNPTALTFEGIKADKETMGLKFLYFYDRESANASLKSIKQDLGDRYATLVEGKDLRGREMFKVVVTNPDGVSSVNELAGIDDFSIEEKTLSEITNLLNKYKDDPIITTYINESKKIGYIDDRAYARIANKYWDELSKDVQLFLEFEAPAVDFETPDSPYYKGFGYNRPDDLGHSQEVHGSHISMLREVINESRFSEYENELAGISSDNPFEVLSSYLNGQKRLKYGRLSKITAEITELKKSGSASKLKAKELERTRVINDIAELEQSIDEYTAKKEAENLITLASKQLAWVTSTLGKESITASEITEANNIIDLWRDIREALYDETDEVPEDMQQAFTQIRVMTDSNDLYGNLYRVMANYLAEQAKYDSAEDMIKQFHNVDDISFIRQWGLDLSHTGIKLITSTDKYVREYMTRADGEIVEIVQQINEMFEKLSSKNKSYNPIFQVDSNGERTGNITNRYSQSWYDSFGEVKRELYNSIKAINQSDVSDSAKKKAKRSAYIKYKNWTRANSEMIDIRFFIETNFSDGMFTTKTYTEYLESIFGVKRTQEIIAQALEQYDKYLEALENTREDYLSQFNNGEITQEEYDDKLTNWKLQNSPEVFIRQNEPDSTEFHQSHNPYVIVKPKKFINGKLSGWYDANFETIENDPDLLELYNYIRAFMDEMMSYLPKYLTKDQDVHAGFLPRIQKELLAGLTMKDFIGGLATMKADWIDSITTSDNLDNRHLEINPATGKPYRSIPSAFIANIPVDERSFELDKVMAAFAKMAITYKWKSKVEDKLLLVNRFVENISQSEKRKQNTTDELTALRKSLEYYTDFKLYDEKKAVEGISNIKLFNGNTYLADDDIKSEVDKLAKELRTNGLNEEEINSKLKEKYGEKVKIVTGRTKHNYLKKKIDEADTMLDNGEINEAEYNKIVEPLEEEAKHLGRSIVGSMVGDKLLRFNQALALGFNPFSAVNNYLFGVTSNIMWAAGNRDFTSKEMRRAFGIMWKSALSFNKKKYDKAANLMIKFNTLSESIEYKSSGKNETLEKIKNSPYVLLKSGDYMIKGQTFIAKMLHTKIKDINGKERSLYDAFDNEGNWRVEEFGDNKQWNGSFSNTEEMNEFINFRSSAIQLIKKLHGNFDPDSPVMYKKYILGRMVGQFRFSWMMEGVEQRFGKRRYDDLLEREVYGRWRTYADLGVNKSLRMLLKLALHQASAFKGVKPSDRAIVEENMRRNLSEIYLYAMMTIIYLVLKGTGDDDDDKKRYIVMNMLQRVMADTTFYFNPNTFTSIIQDPLPVIRVYKNAKKAFDSAGQLIIEDDLTEHEAEQKWLNVTNAFPYINQYNRFKYLSEKVREY